MNKKKKCPQMKCVFNQLGGCRACSVCGCEPNFIDDNCDKCWNCCSDEGILRWDLGEEESEEELQAELKPIEVKA